MNYASSYREICSNRFEHEHELNVNCRSMMSKFCIPQYFNAITVAHCAVLNYRPGPATRGKQGSSRQSGAGAGAVQLYAVIQLHSYTVIQGDTRG